MTIRLTSIQRKLLLGASLAGLAGALVPATANAGPCSDGIAELGRKLSQSPSLGPVTTGTLSGSAPAIAPGAAQAGAQAGAQTGAPAVAGTSADNRVGGTAGTKEANATVGNLVATSSQDVRRQQEGLPTAAAVAAAGSGKTVETAPQTIQGGAAQGGAAQGGGGTPNDRMSEAKMELEKARMLDAGDDSACRASLDRTRQLMN